MPKNPVIVAQQKLYESTGNGGTADDIKAARKALKAEWDKATPEERKQAKRWGRA